MSIIDEWKQLIPKSLVACFEEDNPPVIFIGSGLGKEAIPPLRTSTELIADLRKELEVGDSGETLAELLQYLKNRESGTTRGVVSWLRQKLGHGQSAPGGAHYLLLSLPLNEILTTNYDLLLNGA